MRERSFKHQFAVLWRNMANKFGAGELVWLHFCSILNIKTNYVTRFSL
jgi:hypothetical protein